MTGGLASGLVEVEERWSVLDLVEAHLLLDWQEEAERIRRKRAEKEPRPGAR